MPVETRAKQRKNIAKGKNVKAKETEENGGMTDVKNGHLKAVKPPPVASSKVGFLVKSTFYVILSTFVVVATVVSIDYKTGQLREAYQTNVPPEVSFDREPFVFNATNVMFCVKLHSMHVRNYYVIIYFFRSDSIWIMALRLLLRHLTRHISITTNSTNKPTHWHEVG